MTEDREAVARLFMNMILRAKSDIKEFAGQKNGHYQTAISFIFDDDYCIGFEGEEITMFDICKFMGEPIRGLRAKTIRDLKLNKEEIL